VTLFFKRLGWAFLLLGCRACGVPAEFDVEVLTVAAVQPTVPGLKL